MHSKAYSRVCVAFRRPYFVLTSLTAYQTEIDSLTKRSKTSENAFLHVYKILAEAPDPYPLLEAAVVRQHSDLIGVHLLTTGVGPSCESGRGP